MVRFPPLRLCPQTSISSFPEAYVEPSSSRLYMDVQQGYVHKHQHLRRLCRSIHDPSEAMYGHASTRATGTHLTQAGRVTRGRWQGGGDTRGGWGGEGEGGRR
ncbi:hypothetical protein KC19_12G076700 [Ceratodon purpureus]|uniref:Uncharacterized protein n=1 Tax=Ceratodon purpureus TaxID=3225 RepID=A0A8T0G5B7_CERPU|nr:hypothetical protein KC19_12G076700 [Ceratodon purpureus]